MVSDRLRAWIAGHFPPEDVEPVLSMLVELEYLGEEIERIQAAVVLLSGGDSGRFLDAVALAQVDWRDLLVAAQLAHADWPARLDAALGPSSGP